MPDLWIDLIKAIERVCTARDGSVAGNKMAFIQACADGLIATRWRGHHLDRKPSISRQDWAGADIDVKAGRVLKADGNGMMFVDVCEGDLQTWLIGTTIKIRKKKTPVQQERAKKALKALFGDQLPAQSEVSNPELDKRVNAWLTSNEIGSVSLDSIVRAAGRRSK